MNEFVRIEYYPRVWKDNYSQWVMYKGDDGKPLSTLLSVNTICAISCNPTTRRLYNKYEDTLSHTSGVTTYENAKVHVVTTNIAYGRGINGVDFNSYYITESCYNDLLNCIKVL